MSGATSKQKMLVARIIVAIITILAMGLLMWLNIDIIGAIKENGWAALGWAVIISVYAPVLCGVSLLISLICLIVSINKLKKKLVSKGTVGYFVFFAIIPILVFAFTIWGIPLLIK